MNALDELRENLREAARRDIEAHRRRRRRRGRATGLVAIALLGGGAAATATNLISVGEPAPQPRDFAGREFDPYRPANPAGVRLVMTADAGGSRRLPFGVAVYTARNKRRCIIAGQLRGSQLGVEERGVFRPYRDRLGVCGGQRQSFHSAADFGDRTVVFGFAGPRVRRVGVRDMAEPRRPGPEGAFMFVFERLPVNPGPSVYYE